MTERKLILGGIEAGGESFLLSIAEGVPTNVVLTQSIPTTTPDETLGKALNWLKDKKIAALGIACFGPVDLDPKSKTYGFITSTPKPGWKNVDVVGRFRPLNVPIEFQTDVNAAATGEMAYGKHGDINSCVYVTVGTGVGVGVIANGKAVTGILHPEGGHIRLPRHPDDKYAGFCPFHKDCLEGLTNTGAISTRFGVHRSDLAKMPDESEIWEFVAFYLAQLCAVLACVVSPHVIVLGGGVLKRLSLFPKIRKQFVKQLNGYLQVPKMIDTPEKYIVPSIFNAPGVKTTAGAVGALHLAHLLAKESSGKRSRM